MPINKIENAAQLRMEIARLKIVKAQQETIIKKDIEELKASLKPMVLAKDYLLKMIFKKDNDLLTKGAGLGASLLTKHFLLKGTSPVIRKVVGFLFENLTTNVVADNEETIVDKVKGIFSRISQKLQGTKKGNPSI